MSEWSMVMKRPCSQFLTKSRANNSHSVLICLLVPCQNKRQRPVRPEVQDLLSLARIIWSRDPSKARTTQTEDRDFGEHIGCGVLVALTLWGMLLTTDLLLNDGTLQHLLWTLLFMKVHGKQKKMCLLCGGMDPKTFKNWLELYLWKRFLTWSRWW